MASTQIPDHMKGQIILKHTNSQERLNDVATDHHNPENKEEPTHEEEHIDVGEYLKSAVYGGLDGVVNILVVILTSVASGSAASKILALGVSITIGDGIAMGLGDYLSLKSEQQFIKAEEARQFDQVQNRLEDEKEEVIQIYEKKGYPKEDCNRIAQLYATHSQAFVNIMMLEELGLVVDDVTAWKCGIVNFLSFFIGGIIPLIPYIISSGIMKKDNQQIIAALVIGGVELFALGFFKAMLLGLPKFKSAMEILLMGAAAVAVGYGIGFAFPAEE